VRKVICLLVAYTILLSVQSQNKPAQSKVKQLNRPKTPVKPADNIPTAPSATKDARAALL
jgi:hypothetical protein